MDKYQKKMPSFAVARERAEQYAGRLNVFTNQSMQQVRSLATRGISYSRRQAVAFNATCFDRKNNENDPQNWSTSTSEQNIRMANSSKDHDGQK